MTSMFGTFQSPNELAFILAQWPFIFWGSGLWVLIYKHPSIYPYIKPYHFEVVRNVDYIPSLRSFLLQCALYFPLQLFHTYRTGDIFPICVMLVTTMNTTLMEFSLQISGQRKMNLKNTSLGFMGSWIISLFWQGFIEGGIFYGFPSLIARGMMMYDTDMLLCIVAFVHAILDLIYYYYTLLEKGTHKLDLGSTQAAGRRSCTTTMAFRTLEMMVLYYGFTHFPQTNNNDGSVGSGSGGMDKTLLHATFVAIVFKAIEMGLFFGYGTYLGQTWIDRGPKVPCSNTLKFHLLGLTFRLMECTIWGHLRCAMLGMYLHHWIYNKYYSAE